MSKSKSMGKIGPMGALSFGAMFLKSQLFVKIPYPKSDFSGQTIIVTGANTGLGFEAARHFVRLNAAKVILACRTISKGEAAAAEISRSLGAPRSCLEVWQVDLSNYDSIISFVGRVKTLDRLDAVVQNAGILTTKFSLAEDQESTITVNVIGAVLLALSLLPKLQESAAKTRLQGRLTFVGSDLCFIAKFAEKDASGSIYDALKLKEGADMDDRYKVSKVLVMYAVREISSRLPVSARSNVVINCNTPGACKSDIFRDDVGWFQALMTNFAVAMIARTTEVGSRILVHAVQPDVGEHTHGGFLMDTKLVGPGPNIDSEGGRAMQKRANAELFAILEDISPGITKF